MVKTITLQQLHHCFDAVRNAATPVSKRRAGCSGASYEAEHPRIILDQPGSGLFLKSLDISLFAHCKKTITVYFQKILGTDNRPNPLTIITPGGDEGTQGDKAGLKKQLDHFGNTPKILAAIFSAKAQIGAQPMGEPLSNRCPRYTRTFSARVKQKEGLGANMAEQPSRLIAVASYPRGGWL